EDTKPAGRSLVVRSAVGRSSPPMGATLAGVAGAEPLPESSGTGVAPTAVHPVKAAAARSRTTNNARFTQPTLRRSLPALSDSGDLHPIRGFPVCPYWSFASTFAAVSFSTSRLALSLVDDVA